LFLAVVFAMLIAFNKPYGVICQFSPSAGKPTLKDFIPVPDVYPAGRLDTDSEGLLLLTDDGALQARISAPSATLAKTYWAQVEGTPSDSDLLPLLAPLDLGDFVTKPAGLAKLIAAPPIWPRDPPIRIRASIPTSWIELQISEGKNRQVRRMTAKIGFPTLRLARVGIGGFNLIDADIGLGKWREITPQAVVG
jgi:23S rRNA pseudouridine2457 synthase